MKNLFFILLLWGSPIWSQETSSEKPAEEKRGEKQAIADIHEVVSVKKRSDNLIGVASSASEGATGAEDLRLRPILRAGELLETVPGLIITQHSGDGKANQYFLRGFNLDHGTDFRVNLDHMQINMPTHGHGQGYADLNFLIPELVETVQFKKGPYDASSGDFSAAGSTDISYVDELERPLIKLTGGSYNFSRALLGWSHDFGSDRKVMAAMELGSYDGPWERPNDSRKVNGVVRLTQGDALRGSSFMLMGYDQEWLSTDQIPQRAVTSGLINRFDLLDPDLGGTTSRYSLSYAGHRTTDRARQEWHIYLASYDLELYSNFTYFLDNPEAGDEFVQVDDRVLGGFGYKERYFGWWGSKSVETIWGLESRMDRIDNGLGQSVSRVRQSVIRQDEVLQLSAGAFVSQEIQWNNRLRSTFGLRADYFYADVDDELALNSGSANDALISPKVSVAWQFNTKTEAYFNVGYGFHSNDARGTTIRVDPTNLEPLHQVPALVRAKGADIGFVTRIIPGLQSAFTFFGLELDSELVFVGDGGGTEAGRPSRRIGFEWANYYRLGDSWALDADLSWAQGRFTDEDPAGDRIPGAVSQIASAGLVYFGLQNLNLSLRYRYFGDVALVEDNSVRGENSQQLNATVAYRLGEHLSIGLDIFNLTDSQDPDVQYFYASRLQGEPTGGIEDIHFHPLERRGARLFVKWGF